VRYLRAWGNAIGILLPVALYLWLALPDLHLPAPYTDELFFAPSAMEMAGYDLPQDYKEDIGLHEFRVSGRSFPVMALQYLGMLRAYFQGAVFRLFGASLGVLRGFHLVLGVLGILAAYLFARGFFRDPAAGALTALFLALDPSYLFSTRTDSVGFSLSMVLRSVSLLLLLLWWRGGAKRFLYGAAFLVGLALSDKAIALWFYGGIVAAAFLLRPVTCCRRFFRLSWKPVLVSALLALAGGLIFFSWYGPRFGHFFGTWLWGSLSSSSQGVSDGDFAGKLMESAGNVLHLAVQTFSGYLRPDMVGVGDFGATLVRVLTSPLIPLFVLPALFIPWAWCSASMRDPARKALFLVLAGGLVVFQILLLPALESPFDLALDYHHLLVTYPLFQCAAAGILAALIRAGLSRPRTGEVEKEGRHTREHAEAAVVSKSGGSAPDRPVTHRNPKRTAVWYRATGLLVILVLALPLGANALRIRRVGEALRLQGGLGLWSDSLYRVEAYLMQEAEGPVLCADWGINRPLLFLSGGGIRTVSTYHRYVGKPGNGLEDPEYLAFLQSLFLREPNLLIVGHVSPWVAFDGAQGAVFEAARRSGKALNPVAEFRTRLDDPVYRIWSLSDR